MLLFPNAKINLGLNVTAKRPDGFHNIETIFIPISLCDVLEFVELPEGDTKLAVTGAVLDGLPDDNLVVKAWKLMHEKFDIPAIDIHLHKLIPTGAGLGGGSADAAFMLKGLNEFFQCGASDDELEKFASTLGSDCAFFIRNIPAYAEGRGEILEPISIKFYNYRILLINPAIHVATRDAYSGVIPEIPDTSLKQSVKLDIIEWQQYIKNDFEKSVFLKHPRIYEIKEKLISFGAVYAAMSGSGSTVYGIFNPEIDIQPLLAEYNGYFYWFGELTEK